MNARVVVAVPNWNGGDLTLDCLKSLSRVQSPEIQQIVIDNGSVDGSPDAIRAAHPHVGVILIGENQGFAAAANVGLAFARRRGAEYGLILNNDAFVDEDAIRLLVDALDQEPTAAAAGPTIRYAADPERIWSAGGIIDWRRGQTAMAGIDETDEGQFGEQPRPVPFVSGCAILIRLQRLDEVGPFDSRFFAYYEDVEWCVRCRRYGQLILHVPRARAWHRISAAARDASPLVHYYMARNRLLFLRAAKAPAAVWCCALLDDVRTLLTLSLRPKWRGKRAQRDAIWRALTDFSRGRVGRAPLPRA